MAAAEQPRRTRTTPGAIGFVPELESLRGIAALMVAAAHAATSFTAPNLGLWSDPRSWTNPAWSGLLWTGHTLSNATGAVNLFFVLSGFVLASSIARGPQGIGPAAHHFFISRIFRLYPAIISTVLLFCIIFWLTGAMIPGNAAQNYAGGNIVRNMLLINWNIDGVMWTLQVEAVAIPLIFLVTIGQQRLGGKFTLALGLGLLVYSMSVTRPYRYLVEHGAIVIYFYAFVFGIGAHLVGPRLLQRVGRSMPWLIAAALVIFFVPREVLGLYSRWARLAECGAAFVLVVILAYGRAPGLKRVLNLPLFRFYGRISYSFYLLHPLTLFALWAMPAQLSHVLDAGVPAVFLWIGLTILSVVAITPLAWLSWRFVEIPGIAAGRRLSPERRNASPYVGPHGRVVHNS